MNSRLRIALGLALIIYFFVIYFLLKKKNLKLKYSLTWIFAGLCMICLLVFPDFLIYIGNWLGIVDATNLLFAIIIFLILIIQISLTSIVSRMGERNKTLVQYIGILEKRLRDLERFTKL